MVDLSLFVLQSIVACNSNEILYAVLIIHSCLGCFFKHTPPAYAEFLKHMMNFYHYEFHLEFHLPFDVPIVNVAFKVLSNILCFFSINRGFFNRVYACSN